MQSTSQDSPSVMQPESGSPNAAVEAPGGTSIETTGNILQLNREDSSRISSEDPPKSPTPKKRSHETSQQISDGDGTVGDVSNKLVIYDPEYANRTQGATPAPIHNDHDTSPLQNSPEHVLLFTGDPTSLVVQCNDCLKWRLVPSKAKYEEIREHYVDAPFTCKEAHEWHLDITCGDPEDISQDGSMVWAIDKHNIPRPPPGWTRELRIRAPGGAKFADVYYSGPTPGRKMRSKVEIQKYLQEHPVYSEGVNLSQFSFKIPTPLQQNYIRKRQKKSIIIDVAASGSTALEPLEVTPIAMANPFPNEDGQSVSNHGGSSSYFSKKILMKELLDTKLRKEYDALMFKDTSNLNKEQLAYLQQRKEELLRKLNGE